MAQQPKRLPGEPNPTREADGPTPADFLGRESFSGSEGLGGGGPFGAGDGGIIKRILEFRDRRKNGQAAKRHR